MNVNKNSKPQGMMDRVVEEELCRQAFSLFDKSGSGTISKTVCIIYLSVEVDVSFRCLV